MNKKAGPISLEFLFNLILGVIIIGLFMGCSAKYYNLALKKDPFYETINFIEEVSADEKINFEYMTISIPKDKALIGFSEGSKQFEYYNGDEMCGAIQKPSECDDKGCLCLCEDFILEEGVDADIDTGEIANTCSLQCKIVKCRSPKGVGFVDSVYLDEEKSRMWKGGFLLSGGSKAVYIRKFDDKMSVCDISSCTKADDKKTA